MKNSSTPTSTPPNHLKSEGGQEKTGKKQAKFKPWMRKLDGQIEFFYVLAAQELPGFSFQSNFSTFQNIGPVADFQGELHALVDQEGRHTPNKNPAWVFPCSA